MRLIQWAMVATALVMLAGAVQAQSSNAPKSHSAAAKKSSKPVTTAASSRNAKATSARQPTAAASTRQKTASRARPVKQRAPLRPSEGQLAGLHKVEDPLDLRSSVALVVDQDTDEVLFEKNPEVVLPIASITKLMTALVTLEAGLDLDEVLTVTRADRTIDRVTSRLVPGVKLTRAQALHLALMSSENHAAQLLGRTYPGGVPAFVDAMNAKARLLGMHDSHFADPTGLSSENRSSPRDLVRLVKSAHEYEEVREFSVSTELSLPVGKRTVRYGSTNRLTGSPDWDITLQKTGFISAAGRCLVMSAVIEGQRVVMVLLDSVGKYSRIGDAQRLREWLATRPKTVPELPLPAMPTVPPVPVAASVPGVPAL